MTTFASTCHFFTLLFVVVIREKENISVVLESVKCFPKGLIISINRKDSCFTFTCLHLIVLVLFILEHFITMITLSRLHILDADNISKIVFQQHIVPTS